MKNVANYHIERNLLYCLSLTLIIISCFFNVNPFPVNNGLKINDSISLHSSNKPNYPSGISRIIINDNWTETEALFEWCNGSGSWDDPYIIHDILLDCEEKGPGILVNNSQYSYFVIQNCTFYNCSNFAGIKIENSINAQLFDNNLSYYNQYGIELVNVDNSSFFFNDLFYNDIGILIQDTNKSKFYQNNLFSNSIVGINLTSTGSESNTFYNNNFTNNGINVYDAGTDSGWDYDAIGNYWDDYGGIDANDDGIGDTPYLIDGPANALDNYPIWNDGDDLPPILTVISPYNNTIWSSSPQINVSVNEINLDSIWYHVGEFIQTEELQNETAEFLLSTFWNSLSEGKFNISFYANDTSGNRNEVIVLDLYKDTQAPFLDIITPNNHTYWNVRPTIQVSVSDTYFQSVWYEIDGQKEGLENGIPEALNIALWDIIPDGTSFRIYFYANDTSGNVNDSYFLDLFKDVSDPILTIDLPGEDTYWNSLPNIQATATDTNFDSIWYVVNGIKIILENGVSELLDQGIWDGLMDEEPFTIYFYANDSAGNVNSFHSRTIHKDITDPTLTINLPTDNTYWNVRPNVQATATDTNFDSVWYVVNGIKIILGNGISKLLDQDIWDSLSTEETFIIYFYANDSAGNVNSLHSKTIYKDITEPVLTVNLPLVDTYWNIRPDVQATATDLNLDSVWYVVNGIKIMLENGVAELLNQSIWDGLMDEETFTIYFFANDSAGNINSLYSSTIYKDITGPVLTVNLPLNNTYWNVRPNVQATATDTNFNSVWYVIDGTKIMLENGVAELLNQSIWDRLMDEETFTIYFFANDSAGNINSLYSCTIHKDITDPALTINLPVDGSYWNARPNIQATVTDTNFDSVWHVVNGIKIILGNGISKLLDQDIWDGLMDEETFTIYFIANDSAGNVNSIYSKMIHKDIIDPVLTVNLPLDNTYWNSRPNVQATATDTNFDSVWYVVDDTKIILENGESELLDQGIWDALSAEETFTIYFYANDSAGNLNSLNSRTIHKDITDPTLTINLPTDNSYWNTRPYFQATGTDINFDSVWYVVDSTKIMLENGVSELLDQGIWDGLMDEEIFTIYFYANDSAGNVNSLYSRTIHKDITDPILMVNLPLDNTYWNVRPNVQATATDTNFDSVWYVVDGIKIMMESGVSELLDQGIWDALLAEETFTIYFYANDSAGNVNSLHSRTIHKDVTDPILMVNLPVDDSYWNARTNVQATATDTNFDSVWYVVDGIKIMLESGVVELLDQGIWDGLMDEETFTIYFYANDSAGNVNSLHSRTIHKDITDPSLIINLPTDNTYWNVRPNVQATATDTNFDSVWYVVDGIKIMLESGVVELLDQGIWDALLAEETFTIYFYANDSAGNINYLHSRMIHKDITDPTLTINLPTDNTYWNSRPDVQVTATDLNFDSLWYVVNGIKIILESGVSELLNQSIWDGLMDEETFTIYFYANDSAGNVNSIHSRTIYKDIKNPIITVNDPSEFDVFGLVEPICSVDFYDLNGIDQSWYQLTNGSLTTSIRQWEGSIDAADWAIMPNGTVYLILYANDSLGNIGTLSFMIYKDVIAPSIIIHSPRQNDLFGIDAPNIDLTIYDPHLQTVWYELYNETIATGLIVWTGTIDSATWDLMGNGTVTIRFTAVDSIFNIAYNNVIVRKNIYDPVITILQPDDGALVGVLPPELELYIASAAIDSIWYYLNNGSIKTDNTNWTGVIDESLWNLFGNGFVYLNFFINDTLGNLGSDIILLLKDATAPSITINSPDPFELFGTTAPELFVDFYDLNIIDRIWYQLYSPVTTTPIRNWGGNINQNDWDLMPNGTITIIFFANDSVGNLRSVNISIYRDILGPEINIYNPSEGDLYGSLAPLLYLYAIDPNGISQITYQLSNGTITTLRYDWDGTIDQYLLLQIEQDIWAQFGNGTITIYIFANDTLGNGGFNSIFLRKDIVAPLINIQLPLNYQEVGRDSPFFEVYITDADLATCWYRIIGTGEDIIFSGIYGKVDQDLWENLWDSLSENDSIVIRFYANDTMGNLNYEELILLKPVSTEEPPPFIFPFNLMEMIPLSLVIGFTVVLSVIIKKSRFYSVSSEKHQKFINRMLILIALLVTLVTASILTQSL